MYAFKDSTVLVFAGFLTGTYTVCKNSIGVSVVIAQTQFDRIPKAHRHKKSIHHAIPRMGLASIVYAYVLSVQCLNTEVFNP